MPILIPRLALFRRRYQKRTLVIFGFGEYGDARVFTVGMGFPDT